MWYAKVDTPYVSTLYAAFTSEQYPPPFLSVLVQHFYGENNTEIFYGLSLLALEFFDDTNNNSLLDYYPNEGINELKYTLLLNASENSIVTDVTKTTYDLDNDTVITYEWSYTYLNLQALLVYPNGRVTDFPVNVYIGSFKLQYKLNIIIEKDTNKTSSVLKQNIEINRLNAPSLSSLKNMGLSILFAMSIASNKPVKIIANGKEINSRGPQFVEEEFNNASLVLNSTKLLDLGIDENYTVFPDNKAYPVKSAAYPISSLRPYSWIVNDFSRQFIYGYIEDTYASQMGENITPSISYEKANLVYRLSYKHWYNNKIVQDPTIKTYPAMRLTQNLEPAKLPLLGYTGLVTFIIGILVVVFAIYRRKRIITNVKSYTVVIFNYARGS